MDSMTIMSINIICWESLVCIMLMSVSVEVSSSSLGPCSEVPVVYVGRFVETVVTEGIEVNMLFCSVVAIKIDL